MCHCKECTDGQAHFRAVDLIHGHLLSQCFVPNNMEATCISCGIDTRVVAYKHHRQHCAFYYCEKCVNTVRDTIDRVRMVTQGFCSVCHAHDAYRLFACACKKCRGAPVQVKLCMSCILVGDAAQFVHAPDAEMSSDECARITFSCFE